jgi:tetratricopeptide (TPR) repeat protein
MKTTRALEVLQRALKLRPDQSWAYVGLGVALNNKQEYQAAAEHLENAVRIEPASVNAQFQLGVASFKTRNQERARQCFEQVVALEPKFNRMPIRPWLPSTYPGRILRERSGHSNPTWSTSRMRPTVKK